MDDGLQVGFCLRRRRADEREDLLSGHEPGSTPVDVGDPVGSTVPLEGPQGESSLFRDLGQRVEAGNLVGHGDLTSVDGVSLDVRLNARDPDQRRCCAVGSSLDRGQLTGLDEPGDGVAAGTQGSAGLSGGEGALSGHVET